MKKADASTLAGARNLFFVLIFVDMFGLICYLDQKKLGTSLLIVIIICLAFVMFIEKMQGGKEMEQIEEKSEDKKEEKKESKKETEEEKKESKKETEEESQGFDSGLPDSEEYNKRVEESLGTM